MSVNREKLNTMATKMGLKIIEVSREKEETQRNVTYSKMLYISKPNRPEVREHFQKQLEAIR
ncbi:hypothetical protein [Clostridium thailandense]|uniref:hypothetical protein n=1 Tax=Clostridium thailandense TaxID=2794346 RepID=UPI003989B580